MGSRRIWAALVSLIVPGAGHFVIGRPWRGVAWWSVAVISVLLLPIVVWMPTMFTMLLVRIVSAVEAFVLEDVRPVPWKRVIGMWALALVVSFGVTRVIRAFYLEAFTIPSGSMIPTLQIGDHVFVNKLAGYGRGDIIVHTHPCEPSTDFVKRIVAVGGDTVEIRCGFLYVNDERVASELAPGECSYWDHDAAVGRSSVEVECSAYTETLGGNTYDVVYPPERPAMLAHTGDTPSRLMERDFPGSHTPSCRGGAQLGHIAASANADGSACGPQRHYVVPDGYVFVLGDNRENSSDSRQWGPVPEDLVKGVPFLIWWSSTPERGVDWGRLDKPL